MRGIEEPLEQKRKQLDEWGIKKRTLAANGLTLFFLNPHLGSGRLQGLSKQDRVIRMGAKGLIPTR